MNGDMFLDEDALKTTLRTSQVCRRWRDFMLATPSLWAKLIDLNSLQDCTTDEWRNELMRRTGTALLWIAARGLPIVDDSGVISFFFDIITKHWHRIQKIFLRGIDSKDVHLRPRPRWNSLYLPAPNLQTFDLDFYLGDSPSDNVDEEFMDAPLFSNDAPMLREFHARECRFDLGAPWLHHLHVLHIDIELNINEILTTLKMTPHLRDLQIHQVVSGKIAPSLPIISLPVLSRLTLFAGLVVGATLFDHLELPLSCATKIYLRIGMDGLSEELCCSCMQTVSRVARNTFRLNQPQKLLLHCSSDTLALQNKTQTDKECFEFRISSLFDLSLFTITTFFEEFTLPELSTATEIYLENSTDFPAPTFASFSACLSSVTVLTVTTGAIDFLVSIQDELSKQADRPIIIFPHVKTVVLDDFDRDLINLLDSKAIFKFLVARIENECPIDTLDITKCNTGVFLQVDFSKEMMGMKVLWKMGGIKDVFEYICGSSDPDRLPTFT